MSRSFTSGPKSDSNVLVLPQLPPDSHSHTLVFNSKAVATLTFLDLFRLFLFSRTPSRLALSVHTLVTLPLLLTGSDPHTLILIP